MKLCFTCLSTETRSLGSKLNQLISEGSIEISTYRRASQKNAEPELAKICKANEFSTSEFPNADFYKIKVLDYSLLTEDLEVN